MEVKRLYEQTGPTGKRLYSFRDLSLQFACSETTIMRCVKGLGAFMGLPTPKQQDEIKADAAASLQKLLAMDNSPTTQGSSNEQPEARPSDPNQRIDPADGRTERLDPVSGKWFKLHY